MKVYPNYIRTNNNLFPEIPDSWTITKTKYVANTYAGGTPSTANENYWKNGTIPWLPSGKLQNCEIESAEKFITEEGLNNSSTKWIKPNTVLIALTGATCANIGYLRFQACANQSVVAIDEFPDQADSRFLYYMFLSMREQILTHQTGGAQSGINDGNVKNLYLVQPSLKEQTKIAQFLDYQTGIIDALIQKKEQLIEKLQEQRQAIINEAVTKGLDPNAKMKDSGVEWLGEIPEGWNCSKIKYLSETISKGTTPSTEGRGMTDSGIRYIKAENIQASVLSASPAYFIDEETHEILKRSQLKANDILIVIAGATIGKVAIVPNEMTPANTNQAVCFIRLRDKENYEFLYYWLQSSKIYEQVWLNAVQAAQPNLSMENIGNFIVPYPSLSEQQLIVEFIRSQNSKVDLLLNSVSRQIDQIKEYRQSLISEAVTGKIDVREWEPKTTVKA